MPHSDNELKQAILVKAHNSKFSIHPSSTKMYWDLKCTYWWQGMKRNVALFVFRCMSCQIIKIEHQKMGGQLQPLPISKWKWKNITMDFHMGLLKTSVSVM